LEGYTEAGEYYSQPCYFFYESLFFTYKDLDAVVVQSYDRLSLSQSVFVPLRDVEDLPVSFCLLGHRPGRRGVSGSGVPGRLR